MKVIHPSFLTKRTLGGERPLLLQILDQTVLVGAKTLISSIFARSASAVTLSEKCSIRPITNRKPTTRFSWSL